MDNEIDRVVPLDELSDFEVAEGDPDVRGWDVIASDGRRIGEVDELLVDTAAMKVRYLDVDLDDELVGDRAHEDRHILIPIGYARLQRDDDRIVVDELESTRIAAIPVYSHEPLTREYEASLRVHYDRDFTGASEGDFYSGALYDADRFFGASGEPARDADRTEGGGPTVGLAGATDGMVVRERAILDRDATDDRAR